jgi:hypothetical protein
VPTNRSSYSARTSGSAARTSSRPVLHERRDVGHRLEQPLDAGADALLSGPATAAGCCVGRAGEVVQVRALDLVQLQRPDEGFEDTVGDSVRVPAV